MQCDDYLLTSLREVFDGGDAELRHRVIRLDRFLDGRIFGVFTFDRRLGCCLRVASWNQGSGYFDLVTDVLLYLDRFSWHQHVARLGCGPRAARAYGLGGTRNWHNLIENVRSRLCSCTNATGVRHSLDLATARLRGGFDPER
jgi:hypothetical protein